MPRNLEEKLVDNDDSYRWVKFGDFEGEAKSTIVVAQDQAISRGQLKCGGTRAETRFRLSAKRTSPFKSVGGLGGSVSSVDYWQPRCEHQR